MKILIFDPVGGASGDMILGSLMHLGCPLEFVKASLDALRLGPYQMTAAQRMVHGIACLKVCFDADDQQDPRSYAVIREIISGAGLDPATRERSLALFHLLAQAEACVHDVHIEDVHFHEIGAIDSILDIVGISAAVTWFHPDEIYTTTIPCGSGITGSLHGTIPLPAPATMKLLEGLPVRFTNREGELVTPTGAAVIRAFAQQSPIPDVIIKAMGYGCGARDYEDWPNLFRSVLCETRENADGAFVIETDVDDMLPEEWEAALEKISASGALDATLTPRIMKRGRPGSGLKVIAKAEKVQAVVRAILSHTTSIGVRYYPATRVVLERRELVVKTRYGDVRVKEVYDPQGNMRCKAEYRDLHRICMEQDIPMARLRQEIYEDLDKMISDAGERE